MKLSLASDVHLEFTDGRYRNKKKWKHVFDTPVLNWENKDGASILLLAGDIIVPRGGDYTNNQVFDAFFENVSKQWEQVYYIPGNHEFYNGVFPRFNRELKDYVEQFPNVNFLECKTVPLNENYQLIGSSLWTDMDNFNPTTLWAAEHGMNDYRCVMHNDGTVLRPMQTAEYHVFCKDYIFTRIRNGLEVGKKSIVMTHHAPSAESCAPQFKGDRLNGAYCTDLSHEILEVTDHLPLWVHGHMHHKTEYMIDKTKVVLHARGYDGHEFLEDNYSPKTIELD